MTVLTIDNRTQLRRWAFSSALVVAAHGAIAVAVLTWRIVIVPLNVAAPPDGGPLFIDLAPPPPVSGSPAPPAVSKDFPAAQPKIISAPSGEPFAPVAPGVNERSPLGGMAVQAAAGANAATAPQSLRPGETQQSATAITLSSGGGTIQTAEPSNVLGHTTASPAAAVRTAPAPSLTLRVNPGPLDTSITVVPPLHGSKPTGVMALPRFGALRYPADRDGRRNVGLTNGRSANDHILGIRIPGARIATPYGVQPEDLAEGTKPAEMIRTAIGSPAAVSHGAAVHSPDGVRNAIGNPAATGLGVGRISTPDRIATNAIGATIYVHIGRAGGFKAAPVTRTSVAMGTAVINGREMAHHSTRNAVIGGPARAALPGALSGSSFRPRRD
jgi:hypothetical protein